MARRSKLNKIKEEPVFTLSNDFSSFVDTDVDGHYDCENSGCDDEGICRCYTIESVTIKSVNIPGMAKSISKEVFDPSSIAYKRNSKLSSILYGSSQEDIDEYCIDRILRINKVYDPENWDPKWEGDYYGEEVQSVGLQSSVYKQVCFDIEKLSLLETPKEKVEFVLEREYGFVLDKLKDKNYEVIIVPTDDIILGGHPDYKQQLQSSKEEFNYYTDDKHTVGIRCVCFLQNGKWKLIDGYHRMTSTSKKTTKIIAIS